MIIITIGLAESKRILALFKSGLTEEELLARLQQIYDELVNSFFAKVREDNNGKLILQLEDTEPGQYRLSGCRGKKILISSDSSITLKLCRIRCDQLKKCQLIMLDILIPYSRFVLSSAAYVIETGTKDPTQNGLSKGAYISVPQRRRLLNKIQKWCLSKNCIFEDLRKRASDIVEYARECMTSFKCQFLQLRGKATFFQVNWHPKLNALLA